jgi:hypothetical protein
MNRWLFGLALAVLVCAAPEAWATIFFVANNGNDGNSCLTPQAPCATINSVVRRMPKGSHQIHLAPGTYRENVNIYYDVQVSIQGPRNADGSCLNPQITMVDQIWVQDLAIVWVWCLTTGSIQSRQWTITDIQDIVFNGSRPRTHHRK